MSASDEVWRIVLENMPPCPHCGRKLSPGSSGEMATVVCLDCSSVTIVGMDWVDARVEQARAIADGPGPEPCPGCGEGHVVEREGPCGWFRGCSDFPTCRWSESRRAGHLREAGVDAQAPLGSENDWSIMFNPEENHDDPSIDEMESPGELLSRFFP